MEKSPRIRCPGPVLRPVLMNLRPSSATAKLQTHPSLDPGLFNQRPKSSIGKTFDFIEEPKKLEDKQRKRRPTLEIVENLREEKIISQPANEVNINDLLLEKVEEKFDLNTLETLKEIFEAADYNGNGKLELQEFKMLLKSQLNITSRQTGPIDALFQRIDWSGDGAITWDEFCSYMQLCFESKEDSYIKGRCIEFHLPAKVENTPHRETVMRILSTSDGTFIAGSTDGMLSFWSNNLELRKTRSIITVEQSQRRQPKWVTYFLILNEFNKIVVSSGDREIAFFELSSFEPYCRIMNLETVPLVMDYTVNRHNSDEVSLFWGDRLGCINILILSTTGESLRMWKKSVKAEGISTVSFEQILTQPNIKFIRWKVHGDWVLGLKYYPTLRQVVSCCNDEKTAVVIGAVMGSTQVDNRSKDNMNERSGTPTTIASTGGSSIQQFPLSQQQRQIQIQSSVSQSDVGGTTISIAPPTVASSATAQAVSRLTATVLNLVQPKIRQAFDQSVFKVYRGVRVFSFHQRKNILVTGGTDRIIRVWNPYVNSKPTGMLTGHNNPVIYLQIDEEENKLFSMSTDKCVKVWDILDQICLLTVRPKSHKIRGDFQACHYCCVSKAILTATDQMSLLSVKQKPAIYSDIPLTHKEAVQCCLYNPHFSQVISASENSAVKVWDINKGVLVFEFAEAHGEHAVTALCLDGTGRRLITGGRDGSLRVWNYNNGTCLRILKKPSVRKSPAEVSSVQHIEMNRNKFFISSGWDKRITMYMDDNDDVHLVQGPLPPWTNDISHGHKEDVLSLCICPPGLLASSDYSGIVIVWNLVSGHVLCKLNSPPIPGMPRPSILRRLYSSRMSTDENHNGTTFRNPFQRRATISQMNDLLDVDMRVNKVLFLRSRASKRQSAILVSSGPQGYVHMWSIYQNGRLLSRFQGSQIAGTSIQTMAVGDMNEQVDAILFTADRIGYISSWFIHNYAMSAVESDCPPLLHRWRAHTQLITGMDVISTRKMLISSSYDCTVRLWTYEGNYVATFGQSTQWDINDFSTFQHPMVPFDVLIDPQSLPQPQHPLLTTRKQEILEEERRQREAEQRVYEQAVKNSVDLETVSLQQNDKGFFKTEGSRASSAATQISSLPSLTTQQSKQMSANVQQAMTDEEIEGLLRNRPYSTGTGKRLRHERVRSAKLLDHGGPQDYHRLPYCDLAQVPPVNEANVINNRRQEGLISVFP